MKREQVVDLVNSITESTIGETAVLLEDLSNVVDVGRAVMLDDNSFDHFVKTLPDKVKKVEFDSRVYTGFGNSIMKSDSEYGAIIQRIKMSSLVEAVENSSFDLVDGTSYDPFVFHQPDVQTKFFSDETVFNFEMSFAKDQVKSAFTSSDQLSGFVNMLELNQRSSAAVKTSELAMRAINNFAGVVLNDAIVNHDGYDGVGTMQAVNLLARYNEKVTTPLTVDSCLDDLDFLRFASKEISRTITNMTSQPSTLFNLSGYTRYTQTSDLNLMVLNDFVVSSEMYLQSQTFHNELVALPNGFERVSKWQGSGTDFAFDNVSKINIKPNTDILGLNINVDASGVLAIMFDKQAVGISNPKSTIDSIYNPKKRYYNQFYEYTAGYFNDFDENFVVFYIAEPAEPEEPVGP